MTIINVISNDIIIYTFTKCFESWKLLFRKLYWLFGEGGWKAGLKRFKRLARVIDACNSDQRFCPTLYTNKSKKRVFIDNIFHSLLFKKSLIWTENSTKTSKTRFDTFSLITYYKLCTFNLQVVLCFLNSCVSFGLENNSRECFVYSRYGIPK